MTHCNQLTGSYSVTSRTGSLFSSAGVSRNIPEDCFESFPGFARNDKACFIVTSVLLIEKAYMAMHGQCSRPSTLPKKQKKRKLSLPLFINTFFLCITSH